MRTRVVLIAAAVAVLVAGCGSPAPEVASAPEPMVASEETMSTETQTPDSEQDSGNAPTNMRSQASGPGAYVTYAEYDANRNAFAATDVVLFFNADWCSTCKKARDNIQADPASIPSDLTIVVVDFDAANDLKQKYGVTLQHTFVQIDADGNELAKWSGSVTADEIAQNTI